MVSCSDDLASGRGPNLTQHMGIGYDPKIQNITPRRPLRPRIVGLLMHASHRKSFLGLMLGLGSIRPGLIEPKPNINGPKNFFVT